MRVMHAQVTYDMPLLIIFYRAIRALESWRLFALMAQMREHRFLPLVQIAATGTLVHVVSLTDTVWINFPAVLPPLGGTTWNPWKSGNVLVTSRSSVFLGNGRVLQNGVSALLYRKPRGWDRSLNIAVTKTLTSFTDSNEERQYEERERYHSNNNCLYWRTQDHKNERFITFPRKKDCHIKMFSAQSRFVSHVSSVRRYSNSLFKVEVRRREAVTIIMYN